MMGKLGTSNGTNVVRMQIPAHSQQVRLIRLAAADLAGQLDFDLEAISELGMAVDEACGQLVVIAVPDGMLHCEFRVNDQEIAFFASTTTRPGATLREFAFGWRVLREFTDSVLALHGGQACPVTAEDVHANWLGIHLVKRG